MRPHALIQIKARARLRAQGSGMSMGDHALVHRSAPQAVATFDARAWLKTAGQAAEGRLRLASILTVADLAPAIGFAAGLALAIDALTRTATDPFAVWRAVAWIGLAAACVLLRGLLARRAALAGISAAETVKANVRRPVLSDLFTGRRPARTGAVAAAEGVEALDGHFARFVTLRTAAVVSPLAAIAAIAAASPVSALVLVFTLATFAAGMALAGMAAADESRRQFDALERLSGLFVDRVRSLPAILAFQAEDRVAAETAQASSELAARTGRVLKIAFLSSGILEFFSALSVALVAVYCGFNLLRLLPFPVPEQLDLARAFFVLALAPEVYAPMRRLAAAYHDRQSAEAAAPTLRATPDRPAVAASPLLTDAPGIRFHQTTVAYDDAAPVLDRLDLEIRPGQLVAITGASGAGKTTLLHLLLGLVPLTEGWIEVDGAPPPAEGGLAGLAAWAGQTPVIVPGTVGDNIRLAWPGATTRQVMRAAVTAGLKGDLDRRLDERGGGLSGGEQRRLGLARALLKPASILLLDEPTANLDPASEQAVLEVIRRAAVGRTTLIATHSTAVMALADRVVRL